MVSVAESVELRLRFEHGLQVTAGDGLPELQHQGLLIINCLYPVQGMNRVHDVQELGAHLPCYRGILQEHSEVQHGPRREELASPVGHLEIVVVADAHKLGGS